MNNILALTQCFPCGSWVCIEKILDKLVDNDFAITVVGLGNAPIKNNKLRYITIPYLAYNRFGNVTCIHPAISILWNLPLLFTSIFYHFLLRPKIVVYNGLASGLLLSPLFKLLGSKNVIMYHSFIGQMKESMFKKTLSLLGNYVDVVVANSRGSAKDVSQLFDEKKVIINEHYAEAVFFKDENLRDKERTKFVVAYAQRIDEDKLCFPLMEAAKQLYEEGNTQFEFNFAGAGSDVNKIINYAEKYTNMHYLGYINGRDELKKFFDNSDVVWSLANETYLTMPAVEALASGKPVIIPIYSEVKNSDGKRAIVEKTLVPDTIGWFVDTNNISEIITLLKNIQTNKLSKNIQNNCRLYAKQKYSEANVNNTVYKIIALTKINDK